MVIMNGKIKCCCVRCAVLHYGNVFNITYVLFHVLSENVNIVKRLRKCRNLLFSNKQRRLKGKSKLILYYRVSELKEAAGKSILHAVKLNSVGLDA